jgi:hypothetical protein
MLFTLLVSFYVAKTSFSVSDMPHVNRCEIVWLQVFTKHVSVILSTPSSLSDSVVPYMEITQSGHAKPNQI